MKEKQQSGCKQDPGYKRNSELKNGIAIQGQNHILYRRFFIFYSLCVLSLSQLHKLASIVPSFNIYLLFKYELNSKYDC